MKKLILTLALLAIPAMAVWQNPTVIYEYSAPTEAVIEKVISDGEGGAIIIWRDSETDWNYIQAIDSTGEKQWDSEGVPLIVAADTLTGRADVIRDNEGNYWITLQATWFEPTEEDDIILQKISQSGERLLGDNGFAICNFEEGQAYPHICSSGDRVIITWADYRFKESG
jgi:hypothetical protein